MKNALVVVQSPERVPAILRAFYSSGGLLIPASMIHAVQSTWTVVAGLVSAAFVANWVWRSWQKQPPSTTKFGDRLTVSRQGPSGNPER